MSKENTLSTIRSSQLEELMAINRHKIKQIKENTTNNLIKCDECNDSTVDYLVVIDIYAKDEGNTGIKAKLCMICVSRLKLDHNEDNLLIYVDKNGKRVNPQHITHGNVPLDKWGNVCDSTKNRQDEIDKNRKASESRVKRGIVLAPKGKRKAQNDNTWDRGAMNSINGAKWLEAQAKKKKKGNDK